MTISDLYVRWATSEYAAALSDGVRIYGLRPCNGGWFAACTPHGWRKVRATALVMKANERREKQHQEGME